MTTPLPPTDPLLDLNRLAVWAQERPLADVEFATLVIDSVSVLLRHYGDEFWEMATLPPRVRDIGYFVARNYYLNPDLARQESTGPIQTTLDNKVLQGVELTEEQIAQVQALAGDAVGDLDGIWSMSTTRGPVETGQRDHRGTTYLYDTRGAWPIPYLDPSEDYVFFPEEV